MNPGRALVFVVALARGAAADAAPPAACGKPGIEWTRRLMSRSPMTLTGLAATADGGLVVAGGRWGDVSVELPGAPTPPSRSTSGGQRAFLMRLAADGSVRWQRAIAGVDVVGAVAVRPDGAILVGGIGKAGHEAVLEGPPALPFAGEDRSVRVLVGVYADDGTPRAAWTAGTVAAGKERFASAWLTELAADKGGIVIAGSFFGTAELGAGARRRTLTTAGGTDIFVAALENDGALAWAVRAGGTNSDAAGPIALGRDGMASISGSTSNDGRGPSHGTIDAVTLGDASARVMTRTGHLDALVGQLDRRGRPLWSSTVGGDEPWGLKPPNRSGAVKPLVEETIAGAVATANGETLFVGNAALPALLDGKPMLSAQPGAAAGGFLARVSAAGKLLAATALTPGHASAAAAAPGGDLLVAGELEGVTTYPAAGPRQVTMTSAGREDVFLARHAPDGSLRWVTRLGGRGHDRAERIAVDARGAVTLAARFDEGFSAGDQVCDGPPPEYSYVIQLIRFAPGASFPDDDERERRLAAERAAITALRDEALRAFKDRRWAEACAAYQKVAAARPDSGAAQADLGLCLQRLGKKAEAIAANRKAITLAAKTELADDGDPAARSHAYFNLYKLGVRAAMPKKGCRKLPAAPGCRRNLWACVAPDHSAGTGMETDTTYARISTSRDAAYVEKGDEQEGYADWPVPDEQRAHVDVTIEQTVYSFCHEGDGPGCGEYDGTTTCEIVSADACLGLVGTVCARPGERATGHAGPEAEEIRLRPAR